MKTYINNIEVLTKTKMGNCKVVYALNGFIQNINAILIMSNELFEEFEEINYILTGKLNQDILENMFAVIRGKGGYNRYPSVREFSYNLKCIMNVKTIDPASISKYANCILDEDLQVECDRIYKITESFNLADQSTSQSKYTLDMDYLDEFQDLVSMDEQSISKTIEDTSISYFIGYVAHKINNKIQCELCCKDLTKPSPDDHMHREELIKQKSFHGTINGLKYPTNEFFNVCKLQIEFFKQTFKSNFHMRDIKHMYKSKCIEITNSKYPEWFSENCRCKEHRIKYLDFLLLILIRKNGAWLVNSLNKFPDKLKLLQK